MNNQKGFTLVEVIVVIVLLAAAAGLFTINMTSDLNKLKKSEESNETNEIKLAADAYAYMYNIPEGENVTIDTLKNKGLLKKRFNTSFTYVIINCKTGNNCYELHISE